MEETQHKPITPQPLSEEQFAAFLKAGAVEAGRARRGL